MANRLTRKTVAHFSVPTDPHQFGKASRIVLIALVHADRQSCVRMSSVDADHGEICPAEFMPQPTRHRPGLKADALGTGRTFAKQTSQSAGIRFDPSLEEYLSHLADHAHRSFPLRDVQPNVLLHHSCSESFDCGNSTIA
jgi:hypothetical protein